MLLSFCGIIYKTCKLSYNLHGKYNISDKFRKKQEVKEYGKEKTSGRPTRLYFIACSYSDMCGIIATPANSNYNELVQEAARLSIMNNGAFAVIDYRNSIPEVRLK